MHGPNRAKVPRVTVQNIPGRVSNSGLLKVFLASSVEGFFYESSVEGYFL
jgi:hypothetical protein